ncbi:MAG: pseudouridine synthase [Treponema sp.]
MKIRLDKMLHDNGFGTRSSIKKMLHKKECLVNNERIIYGSFKVEDSDEICIDGEVLDLKKYIYIMLNKASGYVTSTKDPEYKTVMELLPSKWTTRNLFPVGRLDMDTEGLLILTNDGVFAHKVISPKYDVVKKYYVKPQREFNDIEFEEVKNKFADGIVFKNGYKCLPATIVKHEKLGYVVGISEGKYHQVKKMFLCVDNEVVYLKRISIGSLKLDEKLSVGESRELTKEEIDSLFIK